MLRQISLIAALIYAVPAWAVDIAIANAGFEQVVLPCPPGLTCFSAAVNAWNSTNASTFKPATGPGGSFSSAVPEGVNVAVVGSANAALGDGVLVQTLGVTLQPNTTYTLVFSVGSRTDVVFAGYNVELLAGSTTLASDSSLSPPSGTFVTGRVVYSSSAASPALVGQALGIRLTGNARGQASFDKISLDATPTIISSSASQIASGGGWKTTLTLINLSLTQNSVRAAFRADDGRSLTLPLIIIQQGTPQAASASSVERTLEPGATLLIESEAPASSATLVGWAEVISSGPVSGFAIFRQRGQDSRDAEGTAPLESSRASSLVLPFDNTAGFATGVAFVNLTTEAVIVNATIRDDNGAQLGLQAVALPAMGHTSFAVADRFSMTSGRRGIIEFRNTAGGAVTALGLRFSPFGSFTSVPVIVR
jgi:hypothetical protein